MPQIKTEEQIALSLLEDLLIGELGDYSFRWKIEPDGPDDEGYFYFNVEYGLQEKLIGSLRFRVMTDVDQIEIERTEDTWEHVKNYDSTIKYFWMQIKWE